MTENDPLRSGSRWEPQPGLLLGGVGGFAAGHALAGTGTGGDSPSVVQNGFPGQNDVPGEGGDGRFGPPGGFDRDGDHGDPGGDA